MITSKYPSLSDRKKKEMSDNGDEFNEQRLVEKFNAHQRPALSNRTRVISYVQVSNCTGNFLGFSKPPLGLSELVKPPETDESGNSFEMGTVFVKGIQQTIRKIRWKIAGGHLPAVKFVAMNFEV